MRLVLIFPFTILITHFARGAAIKEKLGDAFVCINTVEETSTVTDFQGEVTFPAAFSWRDVDQDSGPSVSRFTNGDYRHVTRQLQPFLCYA